MMRCVILGLVMGAVAVGSQAQTGGRLLVAVKGTQSLVIVDPVAGKEIASVSEGKLPGKDTAHEVAASRDGKLAFLPIYGDSGVGKPGSDGRTMVVIDLASQKIVDTIDFSQAYGGRAVRPHLPVMGPPVAGHPDGLLYVTTELEKAVTVIDPTTMKMIGSISTGQEQSHMLAVSHDGKWGYTANVGPGTVSVLDMKARKTLAIIPISGETQRIAVSRDDSMVFTADQTKPQLAVIDTATNKVKTWIPLPSVAYGTAVTLDGRWLLVTLRTGKQVAVVDLKTMKVAQTVDVADGPTEILMSPDGKTAFVSCTRSNQIAAIDLAQWKVARLIDAGKSADGLAWAK
jgi:DNA-binding beta-propeller fold protein YncE